MPDEIKTHIKYDGVEESVQSLNHLNDAEGNLTRGVREAGEAAEEAAKKKSRLTEAWEGMLGTLRTLVAPVAGIGALTAALRANTEEVYNNAEAINKLKSAQLDLQFLSQGFRADELAAVKSAARIVGGDDAQIELSRSFAELKSKTAFLSDQERIALFEQLVETKLTTETTSGDLVRLYSEGSKYVSDPNRLQNIIRTTQELSPAASPTVLAKEFPQAFAAGTGAGLIPEQIAGLLVSSLSISEETGGTSLRNIMTILSGAATPEGLKILEKAGATPGSGVINQLDKLRDANLSLPELATLVGKENLTVMSGLLRQNQYNENIGAIEQASLGGDLTSEAVARIYRQDSKQSTRARIAQSEARINELRTDKEDPQRALLGRKLLEEQMIREGISPYRRWLILQGYDVSIGTGHTPEEAIEFAAPRSTIFIPIPADDPDIPTATRDELNHTMPDIDVSEIGRSYRANSQFNGSVRGEKPGVTIGTYNAQVNVVNGEGYNTTTKPSTRRDVQ